MQLFHAARQLFRRIRNRKDDQRALLLDRLPQGGQCAEIGVWKGDFSKMILDRTDPDLLYLVDPWEYQPEFSGMWYGGKRAKKQEDMDVIYESVRSELGSRPDVRLIRGYSTEAASQIENGTLDWVYIDGNHTFEHVKTDLETYYPKVRQGGYLIGDDYDWGEDKGFPVQKAAEEFVQEHNLAIEFLIGEQFAIKK
jgi:hypothetical protein